MTLRILAWLLAAALVTGCSGSQSATDAGPTSDATVPDGLSVDASCTLESPCAADGDCAAGQRCNLALTSPACQTLYCGEEGSACSSDLLCARGLLCSVANQCHADSVVDRDGRGGTLVVGGGPAHGTITTADTLQPPDAQFENADVWTIELVAGQRVEIRMRTHAPGCQLDAVFSLRRAGQVEMDSSEVYGECGTHDAWLHYTPNVSGTYTILAGSDVVTGTFEAAIRAPSGGARDYDIEATPAALPDQ